MSDQQFFMVWNPMGHSPTHQHEYPREAEREAERLATLNPAEQFYVLAAYQRYETVKPVIKTELESVVPF